VSIGSLQKLAVTLGVPLSGIWRDIESELWPVKRTDSRRKSAGRESS